MSVYLAVCDSSQARGMERVVKGLAREFKSTNGLGRCRRQPGMLLAGHSESPEGRVRTWVTSVQ